MNQILECVPNFSEGRDLSVIEKLCDSFRGKPGVRLLDYTWDHDHNRCVLTVIGEPEPLRDAVVESIGSQYEGRNHSTVLTSIRKVEDLIKTDPEISATVRDISSNINSRS